MFYLIHIYKMWYKLNIYTWLPDRIKKKESSGDDVIYNWQSPTTENVWWLPAGTDIDWRTHDEIFEEILVESSDPTVQIKSDPVFWLYEVWDSVVNPHIEWNGATWQWPAGTLTALKLYRGTSADTLIYQKDDPTPNTWYWDDDNHTVDIIAWTSQVYTARIEDDQWRSWEKAKIFEWTYPHYWTTGDIDTLTKQALRSLTATYFEFTSVAETGGSKYKADFEKSYITITWIQYFDTNSNTWKWFNWNKNDSLLAWDTSTVSHTIQWTATDYTRYTHNGIDWWEIKLRFYTN